MSNNSAHEVGTASLVIRPNRSLSVAGVVALFAALSAVALSIAVGFTLAGAWMVVPFAAAEIVVVGALCLWLYRHIDDCELVVIEPDRIRVIKRRATKSSRHDFPRHWVRVTYGGVWGGQGRARLLIGSHGRFISLADDINEADRARVARELQSLLRSSA